MAIAFQRAGGSTGTSHTIDIGASGNNRLVVVIMDDESTSGDVFSGDVSMDSGSVTGNRGIVSDNPDGIGNHQELHYFTESDLGNLSGSQLISYDAGDTGWAMHVLVFYGVNDAAPGDTAKDDTSIAPTNMTLSIDVPAGGVMVAGAANGSGGTIDMTVTSPTVQATDETDGQPSSATFATGYAIESSAQTNKTYTFDPSATTLRNAASAASWSEAGSTETITHTTDARLVDRETTTHDTDALLQAEVETTHTTDALLQKETRFSELKFGPAGDPGVDTGHVLRMQVRPQLDATLTVELREGTFTVIQSWTTEVPLTGGALDDLTFNVLPANAANITDYGDLRVRWQYTWVEPGATTEHRVSWIQLEVPFSPTVSLQHTTDALLEVTFVEITHTTDARLVDRLDTDHTTDAILQTTVETTHTTDSILQVTDVTQTHDTDAWLQATVEATFTTDAILQETDVTTTHTADALLQATVETTHDADALLQATVETTHTTDAILQVTDVTETHDTDAWLKETVEQFHPTDARLVDRLTTDHSTDAILQVTDITATHNTDGLLQATVELTQTTDALLQAEVEQTHDTDALLLLVVELDHDTEALLKAEDVEATHTTDAVKQTAATITHSTDAVVDEFQYADPISDIQAGDWDSAPTPSQDLFAQVDDGRYPDDADYIWEELP